MAHSKNNEIFLDSVWVHCRHLKPAVFGGLTGCRPFDGARCGHPWDNLWLVEASFHVTQILQGLPDGPKVNATLMQHFACRQSRTLSRHQTYFCAKGVYIYVYIYIYIFFCFYVYIYIYIIYYIFIIYQ